MLLCALSVCARALSLKISDIEQKWSIYKPQAKAGPSSYLEQFIKKNLISQFT